MCRPSSSIQDISRISSLTPVPGPHPGPSFILSHLDYGSSPQHPNMPEGPINTYHIRTFLKASACCTSLQVTANVSTTTHKSLCELPCHLSNLTSSHSPPRSLHSNHPGLLVPPHPRTSALAFLLPGMLFPQIPGSLTPLL